MKFIDWKNLQEKRERQKRIERMKQQTNTIPKGLDESSKYGDY